MYLEQYKIDGTINLDSHHCFGNKNSYPEFQEKLEEFNKKVPQPEEKPITIITDEDKKKSLKNE